MEQDPPSFNFPTTMEAYLAVAEATEGGMHRLEDQLGPICVFVPSVGGVTHVCVLVLF